MKTLVNGLIKIKQEINKIFENNKKFFKIHNIFLINLFIL